MNTTTILLVVQHRKPIPDLLEFVEGRAYTIDGVTDANGMVTAWVGVDLPAEEAAVLTVGSAPL